MERFGSLFGCSVQGFSTECPDKHTSAQNTNHWVNLRLVVHHNTLVPSPSTEPPASEGALSQDRTLVPFVKMGVEAREQMVTKKGLEEWPRTEPCELGAAWGSGWLKDSLLPLLAGVFGASLAHDGASCLYLVSWVAAW